MNSVFATAKGSSVSISPESLAQARSTLSQAQNFSDDSLSQSPLKSAGTGAAVSVDPEALKAIKRKFADYDDDTNQSPAKRQADEELDYSSLFRRAGSGKAIKISDKALNDAKRAMRTDENDGTTKEVEPAEFVSPMATLLSSTSNTTSATTPLRSTPQSSLVAGRRRLQSAGQFKSPFNNSFRPPVVVTAAPAAVSPAGGFSSPFVSPRPAVLPPATTPATAAASPLSRMCLTSPASSSRDGITPVDSLTHTSRNFTIRVKVTERTGSIVGYGSGGEGRFCCWLSDAAPAAVATAADTTPAARLETEAGGKNAERAAALLEFGKVYDIHASRLFLRRSTPDNTKGIVLFFDEHTQVTEVPQSPNGVSRQRHRSRLVPLIEINKEETDIDLAGIVRAVSPSSSSPSPLKGISPPDGIPSLDVTLVDQKGSITLTLSHEYNKVTVSPGDVLLVYRASAKRVNETTTMRVQAVRGRTKLLVNPSSEDGRLVALGHWCRRGLWAAPGGVTMRSIASIDEKMKEEGGGEMQFATKAMLANVDAAAVATVRVCEACGTTVDENSLSCKCGTETAAVASLQLDVDLSDGTGLVTARASGAVAEGLVGVKTHEAVGMLKWNRDAWRSQCRRVLYESRVFKLRRDTGNPRHLMIVEVLPVPYAAYRQLIGRKLDRKVQIDH